ncbi:non-ribosomal peptide synthetase, partial [Pseudoalteromonas sp. J010]|uniref:condensation domain-containing protein n=1 Tax=Pseudoalteromonas sp. J010 TaxID=998465 RepID=UPI000F96F969
MSLLALMNTVQEKQIKLWIDGDELKLKAPKGALDAKLKASLIESKLDIIALLKKITAAQSQPDIQIGKRTATEPLVLSSAQERLWFIDKLNNGSAEYNLPAIFTVSGELNLSLLERVFRTILKRHEVLRTVYYHENGRTYQRITDFDDALFNIKQVSLSHLKGTELTTAIAEYIQAELEQEFDLAQDLMLRVRYVETGNAQGVLLFNMHHIASDGWSMEVLAKEFFSLYQSFSEGQGDNLPP